MLKSNNVLKYFVKEDGIEIVGCVIETLKGTNGVLTIPECIDGKRVTHIADHAFKYCDEITQVIIEGNVDLGYNSFEYCTNLKSLIAPKITHLGKGNLFGYCEALVEVDLSGLENLDSISIFSRSKSLKKLTLPNLKYLDNWDAFSSMNGLEELSLPKLEKSSNFTVKVDNGCNDLIVGEYLGGHVKSTFYKCQDDRDLHTPSLKKLTLPKQLINNNFDLSKLKFELELL